ncbi:MAG: hydantoinase B/oxoprolinase family protein, partial [Syntrophobacterales bacterium]
MSIDAATLEILKNRFLAIANQMTHVAMRSAYSTIIKEMGDISSSIFDSHLRLIAEGANVPIHLNMLKPCLESTFSYHIDINDLQPGDVILTNDPYIGNNDESKGSHHTNDLVMALPVFYRDELVCLSTIVGHHRDVGGTWPGTRGWNVEIWQEGFRIKPVKICKGGRVDQDVLGLILNNTRVPYDMEGDLRAQISGCEFGEHEMIKVFD